jgi:acyl-CoA synthetase (AMP-forming)/AMP-acid ligase II
VDLLEVEAAVRRLPGVRDAAAAVVDRNGGELAAFVVADEVITLAAVRAGLSVSLPDASVPTALGVLPEIPRLPSGKVDRRALSTSPLHTVVLRHVPPRTRTRP